MEQDQPIHYPGYLFASFDYLPDTSIVDTLDPRYRLRMGKDSLFYRDSSMLRVTDSLVRADSIKLAPLKADPKTKAPAVRPESAKRAVVTKPESAKPTKKDTTPAKVQPPPKQKPKKPKKTK